MPSVAMSWVAPENAITAIMAMVKEKNPGRGSRKAITPKQKPDMAWVAMTKLRLVQ